MDILGGSNPLPLSTTFSLCPLAAVDSVNVYARFRSNRARNLLVIHDCNIAVTGRCDLDLGFEPYTTGHRGEGLGEEGTQ